MFRIKDVRKRILGNRVIIKLFARIIFSYIWLVFLTSRKSYIFSAKLDKKKLKEEKIIYLFWHNRLMMMPCLEKLSNAKINVLISMHRDGALISEVMRCFGFDIISGSSHHGSVGAVKGLLEKIKNGETVAITADGSRGPVYKLNTNITKIASRFGVNIVPLSYSTTYKKIFYNSWDKFIFPLPFGKVNIIYGAPIIANKESDIEHVNSRIQHEMDSICAVVDSMV